MGWINLAPNRDKCAALVNMDMNLRDPQNTRNFSTSSGTENKSLLLGIILLVSYFGGCTVQQRN